MDFLMFLGVGEITDKTRLDLVVDNYNALINKFFCPIDKKFYRYIFDNSCATYFDNSLSLEGYDNYIASFGYNSYYDMAYELGTFIADAKRIYGANVEYAYFEHLLTVKITAGDETYVSVLDIIE